MLPMLFLSADTQPFSHSFHTPARNVSLMHAALKEISPEILAKISGDMPLARICDWESYRAELQLFRVYCSTTTPTHLSFMGFESIGNIHYEYLPPDVKHLTIYRCEQSYRLHTRLLPRELAELDMGRNKIFGAIDLQCLPRTLQNFNLCNNLITGPISLVRLPPHLKTVQLRYNKIKQRIVLCDPLPATVTSIDLRLNKVREICFRVYEGEAYGGKAEISQIMPEMKVTTFAYCE